MQVNSLETSQIAANYAAVVSMGVACATLLVAVLTYIALALNGPSKKQSLHFA